MTVGDYIHTQFVSVAPETPISELEAAMRDHGFVMVLNSDGEAAGLLTTADIPQGAETVPQCNFQKPVIADNERLPDIVSLMKRTGDHFLPVARNSRIIGAISADDMLQPLADTVKKYQLLFQHVSHDLRNEIANIRNILSLIEDVAEKPEVLELLQYGATAAQSAQEMLTDFLAIEKKEDDHAADRIVNLASFTAGCLEQLRGLLAGKEIILETALTGGEFFSKIDPLLLHRVIHNILSNAVKFSHASGTIKVASAIQNEMFLLTIQDFGTGIPLELQPFIFDHFTAAQRPGTAGEASTGLGLYFSRKTIERYGGSIRFTSEPGQGTTFYLELPHYEEQK